MQVNGMRLCLFLFLAVASACSTAPQSVPAVDDWTGFAQAVTEDHEILRNNTAIMTARGIIIARDGKRAFAVLTSLRRLTPNGPMILSVYSGDTRLNYQRHDRLLTQCIDRCRRTETGAIYLTEAAFRIAARTGLPLRIQGRRGRYSAQVPAALFAELLDRAF